MANCQSSSPHIAHSICSTSALVNSGTERHNRTPVYLSVPVGQVYGEPVLKRARIVSTNSDKPIDLSTRNTPALCLEIGCFLQKRENEDFCRNHYRKEYRANYAKSSAGKATRAKYEQSLTGKETRAKYEKTRARKEAKAILSARSSAYKTELAKSKNEEIARQKGEEAAERKRLSLQNKSVDQIAPPLFNRSTEEIFTIPIKPISP